MLATAEVVILNFFSENCVTVTEYLEGTYLTHTALPSLVIVVVLQIWERTASVKALYHEMVGPWGKPRIIDPASTNLVCRSTGKHNHPLQNPEYQHACTFRFKTTDQFLQHDSLPSTVPC